MNYDEARELKDGGWRWTTMNDGLVRTTAPCHRHIGDESDPLWYMKPYDEAEWETCPPHPTREDAERHFYDYCIANLREGTYADARRCEAAGCQEWADKALESPYMSGYFNGTRLCDVHRTPGMVAELRPFRPGIRIVHS